MMFEFSPRRGPAGPNREAAGLPEPAGGSGRHGTGHRESRRQGLATLLSRERDRPTGRQALGEYGSGRPRSPRAPGSRRPIPSLAAAFALLLTGQIARPQTTVTLVSNLGQPNAGTGTSNLNHAQGFTTGSNALGYKLTSVDVRFASIDANAPVSLSIYRDSTLGPLSTSTKVGSTLTNPASLAAGVNTFTASGGGIDLDANTWYFVSVDFASGTPSTSASIQNTGSTAEDAGAAAGWSIENRSWYATAGSRFNWTSFHEMKHIAIKGYAKAATAQPETEPRPREPRPLQLALWTDRPAYRAGETVRLYRTLDPHDDRDRYRTFVYLERPGGGERRYLAPLTAAGQLHTGAVDQRGMPAELAPARALAAADRTLSWEGEAPEPGPWQFVLELRPGVQQDQFEESEEPIGTRRAWAKFTVAERSLLLNRRDFDREIRDDLTLRSDTLYYLGHQLFVRDGATLTIEPGTVVHAWGRNAAIIVEPGGRIAAEGTREAPVVMTCSVPVGWRQPGCWSGLRILGRAPVTRLEGVVPGVLPAERPAYGGTDTEDSSGVLRYVRVEFAGAGADPEAALPAIGLYGVGSGTVLDHVQAHASLGDGFAFRGGTAVCGHCVAGGSGNAGLSWGRGWRGGASHLYVQQGSGGSHGLAGGHDENGHDLEPRSLPALSNVTVVHAAAYGRRGRKAIALQLSDGSAVQARDLLATRFGGGAIHASGRSRLLFGEGESSVSGALLYLNGSPQLPVGIAGQVQFDDRDPKLRDVRDFANPDPRPKPASPALSDGAEGYIGAFGRKENWLEEWTVFGPESVYDLRQRDD